MPAFENPTTQMRWLIHRISSSIHCSTSIILLSFWSMTALKAEIIQTHLTFFWAFKVSPFTELHPCDARLWIEALTSTRNQVLFCVFPLCFTPCGALFKYLRLLAHFPLCCFSTWNSNVFLQGLRQLKLQKTCQPKRHNQQETRPKKKKNRIYLSFKQKFVCFHC